MKRQRNSTQDIYMDLGCRHSLTAWGACVWHTHVRAPLYYHTDTIIIPIVYKSPPPRRLIDFIKKNFTFTISEPCA